MAIFQSTTNWWCEIWNCIVCANWKPFETNFIADISIDWNCDFHSICPMDHPYGEDSGWTGPYKAHSIRYLLLVSMKKSEVTDRDSGIHPFHPSPAVLIECRFIICDYYRCDRYSEHSFAKLIYLQVVLNRVLRVCLPCRPFKLLIQLH